MKNKSALYITQSAVIAAVYTALTYLSSMFGLAFGPVQLRFSEVLTLLPVFTPAAVPALTIGCFLSNLASPLGIADIICGTAATFLSAVMTRELSKIKLRGIPVLAALPPVIVNAAVIGFETVIITKTDTIFFVIAAQIALSEAFSCILLGIPFLLILKRTKIFEKK